MVGLVNHRGVLQVNTVWTKNIFSSPEMQHFYQTKVRPLSIPCHCWCWHELNTPSLIDCWLLHYTPYEFFITWNICLEINRQQWAFGNCMFSLNALKNLIPNRKELEEGKRMVPNRFGSRCSRFFFLCRSSLAINNPQRSQENVTTFKSLQFAIYKRMMIFFPKQEKSWHQIWNHSTISNNK